MVEYYESACKLNMSFNKNIGPRGWQACSKLIRKVDVYKLFVIWVNVETECELFFRVERIM